MKLIIVDGSLYLYRFHYAMGYIINSKGESIGLYYGISSMIIKILRRYSPKYMVFVFDACKKSFRNQIFKRYKANRNPMPKIMQKQIPEIFSIIKALGIKIVIVKGVEADDVIGTISKKFESCGFNIMIFSNDKDIMQLVSCKTNIVDINSDIKFDIKNVISKFGIKPELIPDYLAMVGDISDNIPGIKGIGKKTAQKILNKTNGLKFLYKNITKLEEIKISKRVILNLINNKDQLLKYYKLTKIKIDVKLNFNFKDLIIKKPQIDVLNKIFQRYEIKKLYIKKLKLLY